MFAPGDVISYLDMRQEEGASLQRGMNLRSRSDHSVVLISLRRDAPYSDRIEENGKVLIYEGHDIRAGARRRTVTRKRCYRIGRTAAGRTGIRAVKMLQKNIAVQVSQCQKRAVPKVVKRPCRRASPPTACASSTTLFSSSRNAPKCAARRRMEILATSASWNSSGKLRGAGRRW